jgi:hypothetical protein
VPSKYTIRLIRPVTRVHTHRDSSIANFPLQPVLNRFSAEWETVQY